MEEKKITLAERLGSTPHDSALLRKAAGLGLDSAGKLRILAVQRGCRHYAQGTEPPGELVSRDRFSDEELALALLNGALPHEPHNIRCGAAMLSAAGNEPKRLAKLAVLEHTVQVVKYVGEAGVRYEPQNPFWRELLGALPEVPSLEEGLLPHPTRFVAMTGILRRGERGIFTEWQRPGGAPIVAHG